MYPVDPFLPASVGKEPYIILFVLLSPTCGSKRNEQLQLVDPDHFCVCITHFLLNFLKDKLLAKSYGTKHCLSISLMIRSSVHGVISPEEP